MEKKQNKGRWFLIKHEKCGSVFTINGEIFLKSHNDPAEFLTPLTCPTCGTATIKGETISKLQDFFLKYRQIINALKLQKFTINEIQDQIDLENLRF